METIDSLLAAGKRYFKIREYAKALEVYEKVLVLDPKDASPWNGKGNAFYYLKEYDKALEAYEKSIALDPKDALPWNGKGNLFSEQGEYDKALEAYDKAIALDPKFATPWNNKGNVFKELKEYDKALEAYEKSIALDPKDALPWNGKGNVFRELKEYDKALKAYDKAIALDPKDAFPWNNKGIVFRELKEYEKALKAYDKAIALDPKDASPWNGKGNVFYNLKEYEKALEAYEKSIALDPKLASPWNGKGNVFDDLKEYEKALEAYEKSIALDPKDASPWNGKGNIFGDLKEYEKALEAYEKSIELDPKDASSWFNKGIVYYESLAFRDYYKSHLCWVKVYQLDRNLYGKILNSHLKLLENLDVPFWVSRMVQEIPYILFLKSHTELIRRNIHISSEAQAIVDTLKKENQYPDPDKIQELIGVIHFYMGDPLTTKEIFEKLCTEEKTPLRYYYLIKAMDLLFESVDDLIQDFEEELLPKLKSSPINRYYTGLLYSLFDLERAFDYFSQCTKPPTALPALYMLWHTRSLLLSELQEEKQELLDKASLTSEEQLDLSYLQELITKIEENHPPEEILDLIYDQEKAYSQKGDSGYLQGFSTEALTLSHFVEREIKPKYTYSEEIHIAVIRLREYLSQEGCTHKLKTLLSKDVQQQQQIARKSWQYFQGRIKDLKKIEASSLETARSKMGKLSHIRALESRKLIGEELLSELAHILDGQLYKNYPSKHPHHELLIYLFLGKKINKDDFCSMVIYQYLREHAHHKAIGQRLVQGTLGVILTGLLTYTPLSLATGIIQKVFKQNFQKPVDKWLRNQVYSKTYELPDYESFKREFDEYTSEIISFMDEDFYFSFEEIMEEYY